MKNAQLLIIVFSLLLSPLMGYAQMYYTSNDPHECTPIKQKIKPVARKVPQNTVDVVETIDLDEDGRLETITLTYPNNTTRIIAVQDADGYETVVASINVVYDSSGGMVGGVIINGKPYVRVIDRGIGYDIHYQGRGKFSTCQLSDPLKIQNDMLSFFMKESIHKINELQKK